MNNRIILNITNDSDFSPQHKNDFADWLKSLKSYHFVKEVFNGYEYRKENKTLGELYNEWYNTIRDINKNYLEFYEYPNGF